MRKRRGIWRVTLDIGAAAFSWHDWLGRKRSLSTTAMETPLYSAISERVRTSMKISRALS